jgi:peptide/nickel transport system permease protein
MLPFIIRRLLILPVIIFFVTLILYSLLLQLPPEERAEVYMPSVRPSITLEERAEMIQKIIDRYGLDDPFPVQYGRWLRNLLSGEWGFSPTWNQPVLEGLLRRAPASVELAIAAMIPAVILALALGGLSAKRYNQFPDHVIRSAAFVGWAFPSFILGLILLTVLYAWLDWFPPERISMWAKPLVQSESFHTYTGMLTVDSLLNGNLRIFADALRHLVLPALTLAFGYWALFTRLMRSSLVQVMSEDFITTARAKGLAERRVINRHARRNAILPLISTGGVTVSLLISGVVVVEAVFDFDGIGRAAVEAILNADLPVIVGFTLFTCIATVIASLIADILYAIVDPRTRLIQGGNVQ